MREVEDVELDTGILGTAAHASEEWIMQQAIDGIDPPLGHALDVGQRILRDSWDGPTPPAMREYISLEDSINKHGELVQLFADEVFDTLMEYEPVEVEVRLNELVHVGARRKLYVAGHTDLWCEEATFDYKHSRKSYGPSEHWRYERYDIQSTHYLLGRDLIETREERKGRPYFNSYGEAWLDESLGSFWFINLNPDKLEVEWCEVTRTVADARFHLDEMDRLADAIEYLPKHQWPLGASDWWCSNKWCPAWSDCRGKYVKGDDPWGLLEKAEEKLKKKVEAADKQKTKASIEEAEELPDELR